MIGVSRWSMRRRGMAFAIITAVCLALAAGYTAMAVMRSNGAGSGVPAPNPSAVAELRSSDHVVLLEADGFAPRWMGLARVNGAATDHIERLPVNCDRLHYRASRGLCLTDEELSILDRDFNVVREFDVDGYASRVRISPDGRIGAATVFVAGHSYAEDGFSTATFLVDLEREQILGNLEDFSVVRDGAPFRAADFNFWGVTFADANRFYATLGSGASTYLIEGNVRERTANVIRDGIECPSLSPDGSRLAFKHRVSESFGSVHWELRVLDLETSHEIALGEHRSVDDQVEWLDDEHVLYALPRDTPATTGRVYDTWVLQAAADGAEPRIFAAQTVSPAVP